MQLYPKVTQAESNIKQINIFTVYHALHSQCIITPVQMRCWFLEWRWLEKEAIPPVAGKIIVSYFQTKVEALSVSDRMGMEAASEPCSLQWEINRTK